MGFGAAAVAASAAWALAIKKDIRQFQQLFGAADSTSFALMEQLYKLSIYPKGSDRNDALDVVAE